MEFFLEVLDELFGKKNLFERIIHGKFRVIFVGIRSMIDEKLSLLFKREVRLTIFNRLRMN